MTLEDQRIVKIDANYILDSTPKISEQDVIAMSADDMDSKDILKNPVLHSQVTWTDTQLVGAVILTLSIPSIFEDLTNFHRLILQIYTYFKPVVRIHFQMNSTKFHLGKLIAFYDPFKAMADDVSTQPEKYVNVYSATGQPNVILDAGFNNSGVLEIPFDHILSYLTTNSVERSPQMGVVRLMVLNQMAVAEGTPPNISVNVLVSCGDLSIKVPIVPHETNLAQFQSKTLEHGVDTIKGGVGTVWNLITGNFSKSAESLSKGSASLGKLLKEFDLDKPADPLAKVGNCLATVAPLAHMQGVDPSVRLAATPMGGYLDTTFSSAPPGEMLIPNIIKTKMMTRQGTWADSAAPGTLLSSFRVGPAFNLPAAPGYTPTATHDFVVSTFLSYFSNFFEFWHGSITYRFDFAATQFHSGRILAVFMPNSSTTLIAPDILDLQHLTNFPSYIFDLMENRTFEVTIPYVSSTPRKRCVNADEPTQDDYDELAIGTLNLYVYTALNHPDNVVGTIPYNTYVGAGDDFRYEVPRILDTVYFPNDSFTEMAAFQSGILPTRTEDAGGDTMICRGSNLVSLKSHFDEEILDVRDLARRFTVATPVEIAMELNTNRVSPLSNQYTGQLTIPCRPNLTAFSLSHTYNVNPGIRNFAIAMAKIFTFWSGSMRFKILPYTDRTIPMIVRSAYLFNRTETSEMIANPIRAARYTQSDTGYPVHLINTSQDVAMEVELPFYSYYNQCLCNQSYSGTGNFDEQVYQTGILNTVFTTYDISNLPTTSGETPTPVMGAAVYSAIGDDFKYRYLVSPPICVYRIPGT